MKIPDCPKCGEAVENIKVERNDDDLSMLQQQTKVHMPPTEMWLIPCMHPIRGFKASNLTGEVLELWP